jgi:hypothetical protein
MNSTVEEYIKKIDKLQPATNDDWKIDIPPENNSKGGWLLPKPSVITETWDIIEDEVTILK